MQFLTLWAQPSLSRSRALNSQKSSEQRKRTLSSDDFEHALETLEKLRLSRFARLIQPRKQINSNATYIANARHNTSESNQNGGGSCAAR